MYRLGIDVGGTNTDAVLIDENLRVAASVKRPTTPDVYEGILQAVRAVLEESGVNRSEIAQAMLGDPSVLVLDEPTAGLDPKERVRFRNLISIFSRDRIVLLSTHIVSDVESVAERIILMKAGQLLQFGSPAEITSEIEGRVWEYEVPTAQAEEYSARLSVSSLRQENGRTVLRVIGPRPAPEAASVPPTLEDLYLYYFAEEENQ